MQLPSHPERLWWCPTGPFAFLPILAAGQYGAKEELVSRVSDFVVSSYTPSLTSLLNQLPRNDSKDLKMTMVIQPDALPCTTDELTEILELVPYEFLTIVGIPGFTCYS